jgi:hypothetical protein
VKRPLLVLAALMAVAGVCGATDYDYGASIDDQTTYGDRPSTFADKWEQRTRVAVWVAADFAPELTLDAQVSYLYTLDRPYLFDVDFLTLTGTSPLSSDTVLSYSVGRLAFADPTSLILNHTADGFSVTLGTPAMRFTFDTAYTGLQLKPEANLSMSVADVQDESDDSVYFAPQRLFSLAEISLPEVFARQTPSLFFLAQFDLRPDSAERVNTQYSGVSISGPIAEALYYDATGAVETGRDEGLDQTIVAVLGSAGVRYFEPRLMYSRFELRGLYASGSSGSLDPFLPISQPTLALVWAPALADLIAADASYSLKPFTGRPSTALANLQLLVRGVVSFTAVDPTYIGTTLEGGVNARPTSDLGLALEGGLWFPDQGDTEYAVRLQASFAF